MKINIKAILAGCAIIAVLGVAYNFSNRFFYYDSMNDGPHTIIIRYVSILLKIFFFGMGGYVTALIARKYEVLNGFVLAIVYHTFSTVFNYLFHYIGQDIRLSMLKLLMLLVAILGCMLGAGIRKFIQDNQPAQSEEDLKNKIDKLGERE